MADDPFYDLPREIRAALSARPPERPARQDWRTLRVRASSGGADEWHVIRRLDGTGFEIDAAAPRLRGHVEIWGGDRMLRTALVVAGSSGPGPVRYEFKRVTAALRGPPRDYAPDDVADEGPAS
jgi:hypothetical protein